MIKKQGNVNDYVNLEEYIDSPGKNDEKPLLQKNGDDSSFVDDQNLKKEKKKSGNFKF